MNIEIANRLLQYRKQHNLSQEELAEKIGVSRQAVSKWERAEASPDTDNLVLLAQIYGVSLDELLMGKEEHADESNSNSGADENINYVKSDKVSFKNGIHIEDKEGDSVHINLKNGVNVNDKNGDKVHVGWDGIHVEENGKKRVYTDTEGNVMVDESIPAKHEKSRAHKLWNRFPFWAIVLGLFLAWGFSGIWFGWALGWICFLTIPLYYSLGDAIFKRNPNHFAYPVLTVIFYMIFGYFNICGGWPYGWVVFVTIPVYYCICSFFKATNDDDDE